MQALFYILVVFEGNIWTANYQIYILVLIGIDIYNRSCHYSRTPSYPLKDYPTIDKTTSF